VEQKKKLLHRIEQRTMVLFFDLSCIDFSLIRNSKCRIQMQIASTSSAARS